MKEDWHRSLSSRPPVWASLATRCDRRRFPAKRLRHPVGVFAALLTVRGKVALAFCILHSWSNLIRSGVRNLGARQMPELKSLAGAMTVLAGTGLR